MSDNSRGEDGAPAKPEPTASSAVAVRARARSRRNSSAGDVKNLVSACAVLVAHNSGIDVPPSLLAFSLARLSAALQEVIDDHVEGSP